MSSLFRRRAASLPELYDYQDKVVACMRAALDSPVEGLSFCSAWLYVLSSFQLVLNDSVPGEPTAKAIKLGEDYMKAVADKVKALLLRIAEVGGKLAHFEILCSETYTCYVRSSQVSYT